MRKAKRTMGILLAAVLLGMVPAYAAERSEMPDYFRVEFDAEQTAVEARLTFSYGRAHDDVYGSVPIGDGFYYAVDDGTQITVANANPSDTGFVYICCDIAHPRDALVGYTGESISVPGGYFVDVDEDMYYLGADGQWERSVYGVLLVGQVMGTDGAMGTMLRSGESCTFTLPKDGMDGAYLLYFYYFDPAQDNLSDNYTEYQRNVFQYRDGSSGGVAGFADVHQSDYYAEAVAWAKEHNVTGGTTPTTFAPGETVRRNQAVTFLWRAAGEPEPASLTSPFTDVTDAGVYYYKAVLWAAERGIIGGVGGGRFAPDSTLTYEQILAMLCRAAGEDASGSDWSVKAQTWAASSGLTDGLRFTAAAGCPRSDVVYCLWKQMEEGGGLAEEPVPGGGDLEGARKAIEAGLLKMETNIDVSPYGVEASDLLALTEDIVNVENYYEAFTSGYYGVRDFGCPEKAGQTARTLEVRYANTSEGIEQQREIVTAAWEVLKETVTPGMSDYEIAKALHDYIVLHTAYGYPSGAEFPTVTYSGYFVLLWGGGVCTDYAMAYQMLMDMAGIPCELVFGKAGGADHAWNLVQIDGEWYHVDTTWDDPTPNREGYVRYDYFLKSDAYMGRDHSDWDRKQICTSTRYDGLDLPDSFEQAGQGQQGQEQEEQQTADTALQTTIAKLLQDCFDAIDALPFQTQAELAAATDEQLEEAWRVEIPLPGGQMAWEEIYQLAEQVRVQIPARYPDIKTATMGSMDPDGPTVLLYRGDVEQERQRRQAIRQEEQNARVAEIEALIQEAIRKGESYCPLSGYTYAEIGKARRNMIAEGYRFDGFTSEDYSLSSYSSAGINIVYR